MPTTEEALILLAKIRDERKLGYETKLFVERDWAVLQILIPGSKEKAIVYSPGDRWVSVDLPGEFSALHLEEEISEVDFSAWIHRYFDVAIAYLEGRYVTQHSRLFRVPRLIVETDSGPVELNLAFKATIRAIFYRGRTAG